MTRRVWSLWGIVWEVAVSERRTVVAEAEWAVTVKVVPGGRSEYWWMPNALPSLLASPPQWKGRR
jgi:hypothetical protein